MAFITSLLRNLMGLGSLLAFPGSMVGALCCGLVFRLSRRIDLTCLAEALGTGFLGGLAAYPIAKLLMGVQPETAFVYVIPFLISTVAGSILAFAVLSMLERRGILKDYLA